MGAIYKEKTGCVYSTCELSKRIEEFLEKDHSLTPKAMVEEFESLKEEYLKSSTCIADVSIVVNEAYGGEMNF